MGRSPFRQSSASLPRCAELCSVRLLKRQGRIGKAVFPLHESASPSCAKVSCPECQHGHLRAFISGLHSDPKPLPEAAAIVCGPIRVSKPSAERKYLGFNLPQVLNKSRHFTSQTSFLLWKEIFPDHHGAVPLLSKVCY